MNRNRWMPNNMGEPIEDEWYWVSDGDVIWIAKHSSIADGCWTNEDCWEDNEERVKFRIHIPRPIPPNEEWPDE